MYCETCKVEHSDKWNLNCAQLREDFENANQALDASGNRLWDIHHFEYSTDEIGTIFECFTVQGPTILCGRISKTGKAMSHVQDGKSRQRADEVSEELVKELENLVATEHLITG